MPNLEPVHVPGGETTSLSHQERTLDKQNLVDSTTEQESSTKGPADFMMERAFDLLEEMKTENEKIANENHRAPLQYVWTMVKVLRQALEQGRDIQQQIGELEEYFVENRGQSATYPLQHLGTALNVGTLLAKSNLEYSEYELEARKFLQHLELTEDREHKSSDYSMLAEFFLAIGQQEEAEKAFRKALNLLTRNQNAIDQAKDKSSSSYNLAHQWLLLARHAQDFAPEIISIAIRQADQLAHQSKDIQLTMNVRVVAAENNIVLTPINIDIWEQQVRKAPRKYIYPSARLARAEAKQSKSMNSELGRLINLAKTRNRSCGNDYANIALAYADAGNFKAAYTHAVNDVPKTNGLRPEVLANIATIYLKSPHAQAEEELKPLFGELDNAQSELEIANLARLTDEQLQQELMQPRRVGLLEKVFKLLLDKLRS